VKPGTAFPRINIAMSPVFVHVDESRLDELLAFVAKYYAFDGIPFDRDAVCRGARELLASPVLGGAWLICDGDRSVGHFVIAFGIDLEFGGRQATVTELYLDEAARRRGFGTATLRFIEGMLGAMGIHALELQVEEDNAEARAFYVRNGFEAHARIPLSKRLG
jgi:ribosomal protein S18 acetylase RimI-like enzyme